MTFHNNIYINIIGFELYNKGEIIKMKKAIKTLTLVCAFMVLSMSLIGCKKEIDCSMCGTVTKCDKYVSTRTGDESYICDDCIDTMESLDMGDLYEKK